MGYGGLPGGLIAEGVIFTSIRDDEGGDTDGTGNAPAPADWENIFLTNDAVTDSCRFTDCTLRFGGRYWIGALIVESGAPTVTGCTFESNRYAMDLRTSSSASLFTDNVIGQQETYPVQLWAYALPALVTQNTWLPRPDGRYNAPVVQGTTISESLTWPPPPADFVYRLGSDHDLRIAGDDTPVLRLQPGTILKMWDDSRITIGYDGQPGGLIADGVTFTSLRDDIGGNTDGTETPPAPSNWEFVHVTGAADADSCRFTECSFLYGGQNGPGMVTVDYVSPRFDHCSFAGAVTGLATRYSGAWPAVRFSTFSACTNGLKTTDNGRAHLVLCCFENNSEYGILADAYTDQYGRLDARDSWWGSFDGPSGMGPGSGDAVSDNVRIDPWATEPVCERIVGVDLPEMAIEILKIHDPAPNPFNPTTNVKLELPDSVPVRAEVFDIHGRRVRTLVPGTVLASGTHTLTWNGRDDSGRQLSSGVYLFRITAGPAAAVRSVVMIK